MVTKKRPTDLLFEGGLNLHNFAKMALPDRVMEIVHLMLLNSDEDEADTNHRLIQQRNNIRQECLVSMVKDWSGMLNGITTRSNEHNRRCP
ncbi:hypothetical protein Patl1_06572 [Pistacia atlantica]|uniref:Uncharacterized protein n=1 Tax=Pistacia atlantica TaxID=434234 RepID=A0ACC1BTB4_9ROSI|nr:hypothetical protein Patl1_06572 [Pistacia atlantica]